MKMSRAGFTFVEIIIALGLAAILLPALGQALSFAIRAAAQGEKFSQAYNLAQEDMEAIYYIKSNDPANWAWSSASPASGVYQPSKSGNEWILGPLVTTPAVAPAPFTRTVQIFPVNRDISGNVSVTGSEDPNTRFIQVIVSWPEANTTQKVTLDSYVTNH